MKLPLTGRESVDAILHVYPAASLWLYRRDIICVLNNEAFNGTLAELCHYRQITGTALQELLDGLNDFLQSPPVVRSQSHNGPR